jgi:hypothetical protein
MKLRLFEGLRFFAVVGTGFASCQVVDKLHGRVCSGEFPTPRSVFCKNWRETVRFRETSRSDVPRARALHTAQE